MEIDMKKKINRWIKNVEFIFTKEKLDELVKQGFLECIEMDGTFHYIKFGCKRYFNLEDFKEI